MTALAARRNVRLTERVRSDFGLRVDEQNAVLRGVRILGLKSGNGREYCPRGLAAACGLYEGRPCYVNHPTREREPRRVEDKCGWLENVRQAGDGGLTGDLHLLKSHPMTPRVLEAARVRPELFMLSHNAVGRERHGSRGAVIEGISRVDSVDIVSEGATVTSLFEHGYRPPPAPASTHDACVRVWERASELGLLPAPEARPRRAARAPADEDEARRREVARLRNFGRVPEGYDPEAAGELRLQEVRRLRALSRGGPAGTTGVALREALDPEAADAARAAEVRRLRSIR
jgi:hypothetical protein